MPFRPCCSRVGRLLAPDLCCSCVGRSSPGSAVAPAPLTRPCHTGTRQARGCQRRPFFTRCRQPTEDRPPSATRWPAIHPVTPSARPGMTHRDEQSMRRRIKSIHIADSVATNSRADVSYADIRNVQFWQLCCTAELQGYLPRQNRVRPLALPSAAIPVADCRLGFHSVLRLHDQLDTCMVCLDNQLD